MDINCTLELNVAPFLNSDEVHIWSVCLPDNEENINYFMSLLSEDECQKAESFRFPKDKMHFIISRGILRCLLGKYLGQAPQTVEILYGLWGKPCVLEEHPLHFNLSHSRDHVLYAVTRIHEVGIDLEYIDKTLEVEHMALSILSPQELDYWQKIKPEEKTDAFFKLWVCKEAFLKASGKGWLNNEQRIPLEGTEAFNKDITHKITNEKMTSPYLFECIPGYASAIYIEGPLLPLLHYTWGSQA